MEVAAERIRSAVKNLLPERPHHLALSLDRKYPVPPNFWDHQSPLQYSTFLSDADRGLLLTRPYFDICDEPEPPVPTRQSTPLAGAKKTGNKVSLEFWKSKKVATSPAENGVLGGKMDDKKQQASAQRSEKDVSRKEQDRVKQAGAQRDSKGQDARGNGDMERSKSSISKIALRDARSPSSEGRKRPLEQDDSTRPHKKTKPSEPQPSEIPRKPPRPETPGSREHARSASKDSRSGGLQSNASSRSKDHPGAVSPKVTVNGTKSQSSASRNPIPPKPDTSKKPFVPPMLSPLRQLPFDEDLETRSPKKKAADNYATGKTSSKPPRPEVSVKKKAATPEIPPMLSPTLPPQVEEALARIQKASLKGEASHAPSQSSDGITGARKTRPPADNLDADARPTKIVTIKYKKAIRKRIQSLLALPSRPWPKERSLSAEDTPPPAKKRPRATEPIAEPGASSIATKRPKAPEVTTSKAPYTPPKPPTANSHSAPGSSQTQTPGGRVAQTPSAGDAVQTGRDGGSQAAKETFRRRWEEFCGIGKKLKHKRDKEYPTNGAGPNGGAQLRDYRRAMLTVEMILAYMIAFRSLNQRSEVSGAAMDMASWLTLEPHLRELKQMARHSTSLQALAYQLHGIVINELIRAYASMGVHGGDLLKLGKDQHMAVFQAMRNNPRIWTEANDLRGKVADKSMRTPTMGNWTTPHKAASDALLVLARFAEREHVNWRAEMVVPTEGA
ncbi:hypothetical protein J7T55_006852 [Diaporthe amygdali]|uniref:uncharacterized protein n=1 Tax=Phomopsis amygdali TaxID=1214568 RepID=UPI0022FEF6E8|nr:uncharacterized protein J7T55_006852 [Diaporthe amygdali]KAJ0125503.1 hypothetical protein J7T55_006852 [Diaporthe amygdali]